MNGGGLKFTRDFILSQINEKRPDCVIVCGPTCSGKSSLALELCGILDGEIVSCDSMQIYRGMDVGTAKPTREEMAAVRHHMIDIIDPWEEYSVFKYREAALEAVADIRSRGKFPVVCGGTGLYVNSLLDNRQFACGEEESQVFGIYKAEAEAAEEYYKNGRREELFEMLEKFDPEAAVSFHKNNTVRVLRALKLFFITGKRKNEREAESVTVPSDISFATFVLVPERASLYRKIDARVDVMREEGLLEEAVQVYSKAREESLKRGVEPEEVKKMTAFAAIGYKELLPFTCFPETAIDESLLPPEKRPYTIETAFKEIKTDTRHYAKRQLTWFKKTPGAVFVEL
ncbi:MAG: tRNA (adenosine(37)-N6)-dimethylallyltransferase MiaA [Clostridia bacterium]|nr:tRNA (adenosine(37)-N6)-dimethylallyltransferase MiaA [Clostridia bacterium]